MISLIMRPGEGAGIEASRRMKVYLGMATCSICGACSEPLPQIDRLSINLSNSIIIGDRDKISYEICLSPDQQLDELRRLGETATDFVQLGTARNKYYLKLDQVFSSASGNVDSSTQGLLGRMAAARKLLMKGC